MTTFRFVHDGRDVTGTEAVDGYTFRDYFDCDIATASTAELAAAYRGADCDGIGVRWDDAPAATGAVKSHDQVSSGGPRNE